jgi:hypothetical protein
MKFGWLLAVLFLLPVNAALGQKSEQTTYRGYLVDIACVAVHRTESDSWAVTHSRLCLRSSESEKSGFALVMPKGKILRFDASGNAKAIALVRKENREDHWLVEATGNASSSPNGEVLLVENLRLAK